MKKSKAVLVAVLAVVLCFMCVTTTTFSWFTRPYSQNGISMKWSNTQADNAVAYNVSNGNGISMQTVESTDGEAYGETAVTAFSNTVNAGERKYYRTDITNSSVAAQNVSLYLSNLNLPAGAGNGFYIGTNGPLKTFKNYSSTNAMSESKTSFAVNQKNMYVGFNVNQTYAPTDYQVHYWNNNGLSGDSNVSGYISRAEGFYFNSKYKISYSTVPWNATSARLKKGGTYYGTDNTDINAKNTICLFFWISDYNTGYATSGVAAGLQNFYSSANIEKGKTMNLEATGQGTITYSSSNTSVATVDSSGNVKAIKTGTAKITVKSQGAYGDIITSNCTVNVFENTGSTFSNVPVVTNYQIAADTTESVYWYIKNNGSSNIDYIIDDVYLTL